MVWDNGADFAPESLMDPLIARQPHFDVECRRQSRLVALAEQGDQDLQDVMDAALVGVEGWSG